MTAGSGASQGHGKDRFSSGDISKFSASSHDPISLQNPRGILSKFIWHQYLAARRQIK
jgi:hypothetical protein